MLALYNTATRLKEQFTPIDPANVRLYVCGPTVYQRIHVGNGRPLIVFDVLNRLLRHLYPRVTFVRNITDIDDKIIAEAQKHAEPIQALTGRTTAAFQADARALGCLDPDLEPRATDHIPDMVALIGRLIERGHAYAAEGHVLFDVPSMPGYGSLSGRNRDDMLAGARVEVADYKRDPADFVLWKPSSDDQPGWDSPWGRGRPGWHIECSAMSERLLGVPFDIHGGGIDLIFPHHENERAQSCCAHGLDEMAKVWMHNGFVAMSGEKMSKSIGNVLGVERALRIAPGEAIRLWMLGTQYRQPIEYADDALRQAALSLDRFYGAIDRAGDPPASEPSPVLIAALEDDVNTPVAIAVLHELLGEVNRADNDASRRDAAARLRASAGFLGLLQATPSAWLKQSAGGDDDAVIQGLIEARIAARAAKEFAKADAIRADLIGRGIILEDGPQGTTWRRGR